MYTPHKIWWGVMFQDQDEDYQRRSFTDLLIMKMNFMTISSAAIITR